MNDFRAKTTTRKGELGEQIVERWLQARGFTIYRPVDDGKPHTVDRIVIPPRNPSGAFICDVKCKPQRFKYADTGIDLHHWHSYRSMQDQNNTPAFLAFVDEYLGEVYGQFLDALDGRTRRFGGREYPRVENNGTDEIRYWHLGMMERNLDVLSPEIMQKLRELSTRNPEYDRAYAELSRQTTMKF